jgi:cardiolipin synthase
MRRTFMVVLAALLASGCGSSSGAGSGGGGSGSPARQADSTAGPPASATSGGSPASKSTGPGSLSLITEPDGGIAPIDAVLTGARHTLDLTMYELADPRAEAILAADAARHVTVRVILDGREERASNTPAYDYLVARGVQVRWSSPAYEATHEKAAIVDAGRPGARLLVMTLNLTSRYYAGTRDFAVVDTDPADIAAAETAFDADDSGRSVTPPAGADLVWSPGSEPALVSLIASARTTLEVESEEMDSAAVTAALAAAARRGVTVDLTMTAGPEWDQAFAALTAAGVHVHTYPDEASALYIHAKAIVADARTAFVGSENFSAASLDRNRELGLLTTDRTVVTGLAAVLAGDFAGTGAGSTAPPTTSPSTAARSTISSPPTTPPPAAPSATAAPATAPPVATGACHPLSDSGSCFEPGEYCRRADRATAGVAGDSRAIVCVETGGGWEWEPAG